MRSKIYIGPMDPAPEGFRQRFIQGGHRAVEHWYGARTAVNKRWIEESGGLAQLRDERREWRRQQRASVAPEQSRMRVQQHG